MIEEIEADVELFKALLPRMVKGTKQYRKKRGLVNIVGYAFKYLFGTMDNRDMETINHFIDEMQGFGENVVHTMEQQVSYVKKLNTRVEDNTRNIVELAKVLRQEMIDTLTEREVQGHKWLAFTSAIGDLEVALIQTREDLLQLQQSLDMTAMGKLSTMLVPPHTFKYHVFAPMGRFQLESIYFYFPPSSQLLYLYFCPGQKYKYNSWDDGGK